MNKQEFDRYTSNYNMKDWRISLKYNHTFRVVEYATRIAENLHLNEESIDLAKTCALLHDIARFDQAKIYGTFNDSISFDHGDKGYEILKENNYIDKYVSDDEDKEIVLKSVKYHNKIYLEESLSDREKIFASIVRDADKLDIMDKQCKQITDKSNIISKEVLEEFKNNKLIDNKYVVYDSDKIIRCLAFIFDFNFEQSFIELKNHNIVERKLKELNKYVDKEQVKEIEDTINEYLNKPKKLL